jgi:hypothetical protein
MTDQEKIERGRLEYALNHPWVLQYNFGHLELIKKYYEMTKIWRLLE